MARIRTIKPEFWTDEKLATLPRDVRLIFIASWNYSDDYGVLKGSPLLLKSQFLPYDEDVTLSVFKEWINTLIEKEMFIPFTYKNEQYIFITNFPAHQKIDRPSKPIIQLDTLTSILDEYSTNTRRILVPVVVVGKGKDREKYMDREGDREAFAPPSFDDIFNFFEQKKNETKWPEEKIKLQAKKFIDHYTSNGWMVGENKMDSWPAAASGWINRDNNFSNKKNGNNATSRTIQSTPESYGGFQTRRSGNSNNNR